jgi:adenylate cyclase
MSAEPLSLENCITEHPFASIIFIDFTQFTPYSRQTSDKNLVTFLHRIYCVFDTIAEQHQLTKIKTNGDQYIAGVGLDNRSLSSYETSQKCCQFALAISREFEIQAGVNIGIKMGIASGNAISGIIGQSRPAFDVWGNTMNLASRLESTAANREIQVCQQTMLYSMQNYQFCSGLAQPLKGLGQVTVYKLLGAK